MRKKKIGEYLDLEEKAFAKNEVRRMVPINL